MESMDDYKEELEASLKKIRVGDVVTGTVLDVTDDAVIVDLKTYADGVIRKEDLSEDPDFNMAEMIHPGDEITATVMATNDGEGNMVLSKKEANQVLAWVFTSFLHNKLYLQNLLHLDNIPLNFAHLLYKYLHYLLFLHHILRLYYIICLNLSHSNCRYL